MYNNNSENSYPMLNDDDLMVNESSELYEISLP